MNRARQWELRVALGCVGGFSGWISNLENILQKHKLMNYRYVYLFEAVRKELQISYSSLRQSMADESTTKKTN